MFGFRFYSLVHPVVLDMSMEGNFVTDVNIDSVALYTLLLQFTFFGIKGEMCGATPLPRSTAVWGRLSVERPSQQPVNPARLHGQRSSIQKLMALIVL